MFGRLWNWMKENRLMAGIVVLIVLAAIYFGAGAILGRGQAAAQQSAYQTATIERGSLVATIGATGTVRANQSAQLNWETSGTVESVLVVTGDSVRADEKLSVLDNASLPQNVILAQSDLDQALDNLEAFNDSYGALGLAEAEKELADAEDALEDAQRSYNYVSTVARQVDIDQAFSNLVLAEDKLDKAKKDYEPYANKPEDNLVRANLLGKLASAQKAYDDALRIYNIYTTPGTSIEIAVAQAELELAKAQFEEAQEKYDEIVAGPTAQAIAAAEARVTAAEATLSQAYISAPFSGVVTDAFPTVGDVVAPGQLAFRLDDISRLLVDVDVSEVDINRVVEGQLATLTFDAAPEKEYEGKVVAVALAGTSEQGAVNFRVTVELTNADEGVRPGMTAGVSIVVTELEDVLLVPNRAVRIQDGQRVIYLLVDGQLRTAEVSLGASSESFSEILDTEYEGETIVLNPPSFTFDTNGGPPPFVQGGGGF